MLESVFRVRNVPQNLIFLHQIKKWTDRHNLSVNLYFTRKSFSPGFTLKETVSIVEMFYLIHTGRGTFMQ